MRSNGLAGHAHINLLAEGSGGAQFTILANDFATTAVAKLDIFADPSTSLESSGSASGNAEVFVYSRGQDVTQQVETTGITNRAMTKVHSEGTGGAMMTVRATKGVWSADASVRVLAHPPSGTESGNAVLEVRTLHQDMYATFKTDGQQNMKADMNVQSDGTGGAAFTVLSTNTATTSIARFDLHAKPASGATWQCRDDSVQCTPEHGCRVQD